LGDFFAFNPWRHSTDFFALYGGIQQIFLLCTAVFCPGNSCPGWRKTNFFALYSGILPRELLSRLAYPSDISPRGLLPRLYVTTALKQLRR
jgi:hypothetical protein